MVNEEIFITQDFEETRNLGKGFAKKIKSGDFLAFYGNLGSGKTAFIQGLAKGLGVKRRIISPTFIIVRSYRIQFKSQKAKVKTTTQNPKFFYHIDLYRTENADNLLGLGIDEIVKDDKNIVALEWAEKMGELLPDKRIEIHFEYVDENKRKIKISKHG